MRGKPKAAISKVCLDAEVGDSSGHIHCGGGLIADAQICQCRCHSRKGGHGRPALEGWRHRPRTKTTRNLDV
jgi:hypothetical protein